MKKLIINIFAIMIIGIIFHYQHPWTINSMSNTRQQPINVTLGESCQQLANRYPGITSDDQQNGIKFCEISAQSGQEFPLTIRHGKHSITVPLVNSLSSTEHIKRNVGIDSLNITFSFSTAPTIMHDDARRALFAMFRQMHDNGWKMFISLSKPRLRGRDTLTNQLPKKSKPSSLDPVYEATLAEWMNLKSMPRWRFYVDKIYIDISFYRNSEKMDTSQPGEYLFTMDVNTGETHHRGYFESEQHAQWRKHWVDMALMLREERERAEAEARRIGLHIDTHYQDPPLPPPPPGMSNPTLPPELTQLRHVPLGTRAYSGAACPQTGLWQCLAPEAEAQTRMLQEGETMPKYTAAQPQQSRLWQWLAGTTPLAKYVEWKLINYG